MIKLRLALAVVASIPFLPFVVVAKACDWMLRRILGAELIAWIEDSRRRGWGP